MITVENLSISYGGEVLFDKATFTVNPGERCGLVGRNGSGKTTLLRLIMGQETPDSGTIAFSKGYRIGYLDQHIRFASPTVIEEAVLGLKEEERDSIYKAEKMLLGLGFKEEDLYNSPEQMSGGYQLRLHLAKVLLSEPDCLLLDEPTNYLDILSLRFLTRFLHQWRGELILISHDREFMDSIITHTLGIHRQQVRKLKGTTIDFFSKVLLDEEVYERTRVNQEKKREHLQSYIDRFGAKASKAAQAQSRKKALEKIPVLEQLKSLYQLDFSFRSIPFNGRKLMEMKEIDFDYQNAEEKLIHNFSLEIERGERMAIIGKNGYGKSTLLRLIAGELDPVSGEIKHSEQASIGYFGQTNILRLNGEKSIEEEIAAANPRLAFSEVRKICGQMMFSGDKAKKKIAVLSGGEKSRVLLGKILAKPCNLLLLDEPTHHLDVESIEALIDALEEFEGAFVIVTHSELILKRLELHKLVVCHWKKQNLHLGNYDEFLDNVGWEEEGPSSKPKPKQTDQKKQLGKSQEQAKALKLLEREIGRLEAIIMELERQEGIEQNLLLQVSQEGDPKKIQELLKKSSERNKEIQTQYEQLARFSEEFESKKKLL